MNRVGGTPDDVPHEAYLAALASLGDVGPGRLRALLAGRDPAIAWRDVVAGRAWRQPAPATDRDRPDAAQLARAAARLDPVALWERCRRAGVGVTSLGAPGYPPSLAEDPVAPVVLFHRGPPDALAARRVAVVGTRRATGDGLAVARSIGAGLAAAGVCVVSGLALGIDAAAHRGVLDVADRPGASPGVAVVAGGPDAAGPVRNAEVARGLLDHGGAILSEVPPGVGPEPWRFPVRNRILAALGEVLVVVESATTGGSMHTVREALRRGRTVLAVPGPVRSPASDGTNALLADGALVCRDHTDVLVALGWNTVDRAPAVAPERRRPPAGDAATVLDGIGWRPVTVDTLVGSTGLALPVVAAAVRTLEGDGWVQRRGGWVERIARGS